MVDEEYGRRKTEEKHSLINTSHSFSILMKIIKSELMGEIFETGATAFSG